MKIDIVTLFPKMFSGPFNESIVKRARDEKLVQIHVHDLRNWGVTERKTVDDRPYGGGIGMILRVDVLDKAINDLKTTDSKVILLDAAGEKLTQRKVKDFSHEDHLIIIAGHYEGVDARVQKLAHEVVSVGDFILTGGELPAMVLTDAIVRLIPGVLKKEGATELESFNEGLLEYPQYTRPENYQGMKVPKVLLSGNHKEIEVWRKKESLKKTKKVRPDLL